MRIQEQQARELGGRLTTEVRIQGFNLQDLHCQSYRLEHFISPKTTEFHCSPARHKQEI
jgi:hypothetical protein